ncbi:MAG: hypothetical protein F6J95_026510 [Leptolyngbya sp. SIO1E4]|nr:hypothetical protein [Leptolyngbya sp. SIO1E4]
MNNSKQNSRLRPGSFTIQSLEKPLTQALDAVDLKQISGGFLPTYKEPMPPLPFYEELKKFQEILETLTEAQNHG